jgi:hypothetical protein
VETEPGNWLGKEKTEKSCVLEAKNEKFTITHTGMWEDSSNLVKERSNIFLSTLVLREFQSHMADSTMCFINGYAI